eukprot:9179277-Pyramimonas_sp.AAC.2
MVRRADADGVQSGDAPGHGGEGVGGAVAGAGVRRRGGEGTAERHRAQRVRVAPPGGGHV